MFARSKEKSPLFRKGYWWNKFITFFGINSEIANQKDYWWNKLIAFFGFNSEVANVGIVVEMVSKWYPPILTVAHGFFFSLAMYADPIIYCCKIAIRLLRVAGRKLGLELEDEIAAHPYQTVADLTSVALFGLAIACFVGALIAPPVGITVAWMFALSGLGVTAYFDYAHQEELAEKELKRLQGKKFSTEELTKEKLEANKAEGRKPSTKIYYFELMSKLENDVNNAKPGNIYISDNGEYVVRDLNGFIYRSFLRGDLSKLTSKKIKENILSAASERCCIHTKLEVAELDYKNKRNSKRLFYALLLGLTVLLVCGSAAAFMPPTIAPILHVAAQVATIYLPCLAAPRFINYMFPAFTNKITSVLSSAWGWVLPSATAAEIAHRKQLSDTPDVTPSTAPSAAAAGAGVNCGSSDEKQETSIPQIKTMARVTLLDASDAAASRDATAASVAVSANRSAATATGAEAAALRNCTATHFQSLPAQSLTSVPAQSSRSQPNLSQ